MTTGMDSIVEVFGVTIDSSTNVMAEMVGVTIENCTELFHIGVAAVS